MVCPKYRALFSVSCTCFRSFSPSQGVFSWKCTCEPRRPGLVGAPGSRKVGQRETHRAFLAPAPQNTTKNSTRHPPRERDKEQKIMQKTETEVLNQGGPASCGPAKGVPHWRGPALEFRHLGGPASQTYMNRVHWVPGGTHGDRTRGVFFCLRKKEKVFEKKKLFRNMMFGMLNLPFF